MIIKESEALNMLCPILKGQCLGKRCMWWEWEIEYEEQKKNTIKPPSIKGYSTTNGHCGRK